MGITLPLRHPGQHLIERQVGDTYRPDGNVTDEVSFTLEEQSLTGIRG